MTKELSNKTTRIMIRQRDNDPKQASQSSIKIIKTKRMRENPREPQRQPRELQKAPENTRRIPIAKAGDKEIREKREREQREKKTLIFTMVNVKNKQTD